jgi:hypothetical protein
MHTQLQNREKIIESRMVKHRCHKSRGAGAQTYRMVALDRLEAQLP